MELQHPRLQGGTAEFKGPQTSGNIFRLHFTVEIGPNCKAASQWSRSGSRDGPWEKKLKYFAEGAQGH